MRITKLLYKLWALFAGTISILVFIELALYTAGYIQRQNHKKLLPEVKYTKSDNVILCMGDSHTYGLGAQKDKNYPAQLGELLEKDSPGKFHVVNAGECSANTSIMLKKLPGLLTQYNPDVVTIMAGDANYWNFKGFDRSEKTPKTLDLSTLEKLKTVVFAKLLWQNIREKSSRLIHEQDLSSPTDAYMAQFIKQNASPQPQLMDNWPHANVADGTSDEQLLETAQALWEEGKYADTISTLRIITDYRPSTPRNKSRAFYRIGHCLLFMNHTSQALWAFCQSAQYNPKNALAYHGIGSVFFLTDEKKKSLPWFAMAVKLAPENPEVYNFVAEAFHSQNQAQQLNTLLENLSFFSPLACDHLAFSTQAGSPRHLINNWVSQELTEMIRLCNAAGAKVLVLGYQNDASHAYLAKHAANRNGAIFVDTTKMFQKLESQGKKLEDYQAPDTHPNADGYRIIAKLIYSALHHNNLMGLTRQLPPEPTPAQTEPAKKTPPETTKNTTTGNTPQTIQESALQDETKPTKA